MSDSASPGLGSPDAAMRARHRRSLAIAWGLVAFIALVFVVTVVRLQDNAKRAAANPPEAAHVVSE